MGEGIFIWSAVLAVFIVTGVTGCGDGGASDSLDGQRAQALHPSARPEPLEEQSSVPAAKPPEEPSPVPAAPLPGVSVPNPPNYEELVVLQQRMVEDRRALQQGRLQAPELEGANASAGFYDLAVEGNPPTLVVGLDEITDEAMDWFKKRYGSPRLRFREGVAIPE